MVDFAKALKDQRLKGLKIFQMDEDGYQYWAGYSAQSCFDHMISTQGEDVGKLEDVVEIDGKSMTTEKMEMDDGRILTFREALDELIELEVKFPRFFCGSET